MAGDHHAAAHGHHHPIPFRVCTSSRPIFPMPDKFNLRFAAVMEIAFWLFCLNGVRETYAVKLGWRHKWDNMGHPFEGEGLHGGKFGTWLARRGVVKGAGDQRY